MLETILQAYDDLAVLIQEIENGPAVQHYREKLKELWAYEDKIKKAIRDGEDIDGTEHFEFSKQYVKAYSYEKLVALVWSERAEKYATEKVTVEFDKEAFEKDMKMGDLPEEAYGCVEQWQLRIYIKPRKSSSYSM